MNSTTASSIFKLDLRSLALFRISLGVMLIVDILNRFPNLAAHYSDYGVLPRNALLELGSYPWYLSLHLLSGQSIVMGALFVIAILFAFALILGYRTRLVCAISWALLISLQTRNPVILQAGDVLLRCLMFWAMFLPLNARFSVDAALSLNKDHKATTSVHGANTAAYMLQVAFLYWFGVFLKSGTEWYPELSAVYYALHLDQFTTSLGIWLRQFALPMKGLTAFTLIWESLGPVLFFVPFKQAWMRSAAVLGFVGMHAGFSATMHIGQFPYIDMISMIPLIPGAWWVFIKKKLSTPTRMGIRIYYDSECGFCRKICLIMRELFLLEETQVQPATGEIAKEVEEKNSWVVIDASKKHHHEWEALAYVLTQSPVLFMLGKFMGLAFVSKPGRLLYRWVASNRILFGQFTAKFLPESKNIRLTPLPITTAFVCGALFYITWWNVSSTNLVPEAEMEREYRVPGEIFRLDQKWGMFAPYPRKSSGWYVISGNLFSGTPVDLLNKTLTPASWDKPKNVAATYKSQRWRKYLMNLTSRKHKEYRLYFGKYLCRTWNKNRSGNRRLEKFDIYYMEEKILPNYKVRPVKKIKLWSHLCYKETS